MEHWQGAYFGVRMISRELTELERAAFSMYSAKVRALIDTPRADLHRFAAALHLGFLRTSGRTLDAYKQILRALWSYRNAQRSLEPPDFDTSCMLYESRAHTLIDHQASLARRWDSARWLSPNAATS